MNGREALHKCALRCDHIVCALVESYKLQTFWQFPQIFKICFRKDLKLCIDPATFNRSSNLEHILNLIVVL